ncbi:MAG: hypothetical protein L0Z53_02565 [Acidobacteriales bacterium]|nr:hypothetical protein [Terriglobales bacterium]
MNTLRQHLAWNITGYRCDTEMALNVLLKAASDNSSVEAACAELEAVADSNTMREQINAALPVAELWQQEAQLNAALAAGIPPKLARGGLEVALDFHDEPFYGKTPELRTYACRDMAKKGTTRFWRIASAYVMWRGLRLTLALTYVLPEHSTLGVLQRLWQRLTHLGLHATMLYLDKGFCSGEVIAYLQAQGQAAISPAPFAARPVERTLCVKDGRVIAPATPSPTAQRLTSPPSPRCRPVRPGNGSANGCCSWSLDWIGRRSK